MLRELELILVTDRSRTGLDPGEKNNIHVYTCITFFATHYNNFGRHMHKKSTNNVPIFISSKNETNGANMNSMV